jgi:3-oxoacyl-[acyl-carrier-protein] synthase II
MQMALINAGREVSEVSYISAHGAGTKTNDVSESKAIRRLLGTRAEEVPLARSSQ